MRILALESVRCKNIIIGEDLGTVTDEFAICLRSSGFSVTASSTSKNIRTAHSSTVTLYPGRALVASPHTTPTRLASGSSRHEARKAAGLADETATAANSPIANARSKKCSTPFTMQSFCPRAYERDAAMLPELKRRSAQCGHWFSHERPVHGSANQPRGFPPRKPKQQNCPAAPRNTPTGSAKCAIPLRISTCPKRKAIHGISATNSRAPGETKAQLFVLYFN